MVLVANNSEREQQANIDLALKMKLELGFARDMRSFFRDIRKIFKPVFISSQMQLNMNDFKPDLVALLRKQYRKVTGKFGNRFRISLDKSFDINLSVKGIGEDTDLKINEFIKERSQQQSQIILDTTQKEYDNSFMAIIAAMAVTGVQLSQTEIANRVVSDVAQRQDTRSDLIATTEVNSVAEKSKMIEATTIAKTGATIAGVSLALNTRKRWDAVLDDRTRAFHASADGQIRRLNNPYNVKNELLQHPSDESLGASPANTINCRCSSQYIIDTGF